MKKIVLLLIGAIMYSAVYAQVLKQGEAAIVYYSPKTLVNVTFTYTEESWEPGEYAAYAEQLLGIEDAIKTKQTVYMLKKADIATSTETDYTRPHKIVADGSFPMLLRINEKGLLTGYNLPPYEKKVSQKPAPINKKEHHSTSHAILPFTEEVTSATTPAGKAHAIAKQIFHLREMRTYLLNGEVEHAPSDGEAMKQVLDDLTRQEEALIALFKGTKKHSTHIKTMQIEPQCNGYGEEEQQTKYYFFSEENGFTDSDNIDADTISIQMSLHRHQLVSVFEEPKKKKNSCELSQLVYNIPGNATIKVVYKSQKMAKNTLLIAQLGVDMPLAKELFQGETLPVIVISEKTGSILSISK